MTRRRLPDRRASTNHTLSFDGMRYHITVGSYEDGTPGEVFITAGQPGSPVDRLCVDIGLLLSLWLQYGHSIEELYSSVQHLEDGSAAGPLGHILETLRNA